MKAKRLTTSVIKGLNYIDSNIAIVISDQLDSEDGSEKETAAELRAALDWIDYQKLKCLRRKSSNKREQP